jgi:hypothetical protein
MVWIDDQCHSQSWRRGLQEIRRPRYTLRGLLSFDGNDVYLWAAWSAVHSNIIQELGLDRMECIAYRNDRWWGPNLYDEETGLYKPALQRITPRTPPTAKDHSELLKQLFADELLDV